MKDYSTALANYRAARREFWQIDLMSFQVRSRNSPDEAVWYHFSSRDEDELIEVRNQSTGELEFRAYFGGGHIVATDELVRSEGTTVQNFTVTLSAVSQPVLDMIQGYDCRDAVFEWHIGEGDEDTGLLVDTPVCEFEGFVNGADRNDDAVDDNGNPAQAVFKITVVSHKSALQQANFDLRSHEVGQDRGGDDIFQYADESNTWDILWGKAGKKHKKDGGGDGRNHRPDKPDPYTWNGHS